MSLLEFNSDVKKIYLAGPLFSEAEQDWMRKLKRSMEAAGHGVVWPQEGGQRNTPREIFEGCRRLLDECDILVAVLDGPQVDDGTAWEIGYWYAKKGPERIFGIRTDFRKAGETHESVVNAMVEMSCGKIVDSVALLLELLPTGMCQ